MGPIEGINNVRESAHFLKFLYGMSSFSLGLEKKLMLSKAIAKISLLRSRYYM